MPALTDARVEELNEALTRNLPVIRALLNRVESATDLAEGHAALCLALDDMARLNAGFVQARMPAFRRLER